MKPEFTFFVMTSSEGKGAANDWNWKPGEVGARTEVGERDECVMWIISWGDEPWELVVEDIRER